VTATERPALADRGQWSLDDATRVADLIGRRNARRVYAL
jgi:hypothetical protein